MPTCDGNDYITNFTDGVVTLIDGAGHELDVPLGNGDFSLTGLSADGWEQTVYFIRGVPKTQRRTQMVQPSVSLTAALNRLGSATKKTVLDFLRFRNYYASNVRSRAVCGDSNTVDVRFKISTPDGYEQIDLYGVFFNIDATEGDPSTISLSGTVLSGQYDITPAT